MSFIAVGFFRSVIYLLSFTIAFILWNVVKLDLNISDENNNNNNNNETSRSSRSSSSLSSSALLLFNNVSIKSEYGKDGENGFRRLVHKWGRDRETYNDIILGYFADHNMDSINNLSSNRTELALSNGTIEGMFAI